MSSMKYHQIEAFYQVMLTGSISKAANNLGRTQPAVSMTIGTLEEQLATKLFDRHAGRITPRAEAQVLFEQIRPVMHQLNDIRYRFGRLDSIAVPRISIISSSNIGMNLVPSAISDIASSGQELRLMNGSAATIVSEMENQRHDLAVTDEGTGEVPLASPLFDTEVFQIPVCAVYPRGLLSAPAGSITTDELIGHQICTLYEENRAARDIRAKLRSPRVEFSSFFPMACFAVTSGSVAIVDYITCSTLKALTFGTLQAEYRLISDAAPSPYYLLRSRYRPRSKMAERCYEAVRAALAEHQAQAS
jgi:DNA-binding transcriptional LysR family regulator